VTARLDNREILPQLPVIAIFILFNDLFIVILRTRKFYLVFLIQNKI